VAALRGHATIRGRSRRRIQGMEAVGVSVTVDSAEPRLNRLAHSTSPYLREHATNPVDWYPWSEEALARARREGRPVFLSIGYSACHWCHVMARESFEDEEIASILNEHFVSIKVDREERPDLDAVYMAATLALNDGQGGWPMSVFLTPEGEPFFAGTYFPPRDRWGRPGFGRLLWRIAELWQEDREALLRQAADLTGLLRRSQAERASETVHEGTFDLVVEQLARDYDPRHGGFGGAPKFPPATTVCLLLRLARRSGGARALEMARGTLEGMARGGLRDHIGGGFHRYSTDDRWLVPHFEKMLYDNALLVRAYLEGHQATGEPLFRRVAREILDHVLGEMTSSAGGFFSASDADSEGEEGRYFVWTPDQVHAVLGEEDARLVCAWYDITPGGNWEGRSIPNRLDPEDVVRRRLGEASTSQTSLERVVEAARLRLLEARRQRVAPRTDDKVLTGWNGLMIGALAEGARVLGEPRYREAAERAADFLLTRAVKDDGGLLRSHRDGRSGIEGFLDDHAYFAEGLLDLYEAGASLRYLEEALRIAERLIEQFAGEDGGLFSTGGAHEVLIFRGREGHDGATPSASATAAHVLARLAHHFDRPDLTSAARRALEAHGAMMAAQPRAFAKGLIAMDLLLQGPVELVFLTPSSGDGAHALMKAAAPFYLPRRVIAQASEGEGDRPGGLPLLAGKAPADGRPTLFICQAGRCGRPLTDPADVAETLGPLAG
jgi:uncharacterized protein YyaL (SSP411 family)